MKKSHFLLGASTSVSDSEVRENVFSPLDYESRVKDDLVEKFASLIIEKRPELITRFESLNETTTFDIRAYVMSPIELELLIQAEVRDRISSSVLASQLIRSQEDN